MTDKETKQAAEPTEFGNHAKAAGKAVVRQWKALIPDDFWEHGREAQRETLLALRALVDGAIDRLETAESSAPKPRVARKAKVEVE